MNPQSPPISTPGSEPSVGNPVSYTGHEHIKIDHTINKPNYE